jgi:hypothetical protein
LEHYKKGIGKVQSEEQVQQYCECETLKDITNVANVFNNYFITINEKIKNLPNVRRCYFISETFNPWKFPPK